MRAHAQTFRFRESFLTQKCQTPTFKLKKMHNKGVFVHKRALFFKKYLRKSIKMCYFAPAKRYFVAKFSE